MRLRQVGTFLLAVCAFLSTCALDAAQPETTVPAEPTTEDAPSVTSTPSVRQVGLDFHYVDKNGELVPVPDMPLEVVLELWEIQQKLAKPGPPPPTYALQDLSIVGIARGGRAELTASVAIGVMRDGWVRVPLRFSNVFLAEAKYEGDGLAFVTYEKDDGYVCYVQASQDKLHKFSMKLVAPVRQVGSEYRLALQTPEAASSGLNLRVPFKEVTAKANNDLPVDTKEQGNETLLVVTGLGDAFQMSWREGSIEPTDVTPLLEVRSETLVEVIGERIANSNVRLAVSSLRGKFSSFDVHLPAGARLSERQPSQSGLQVAEAAGDDESDVTIVQVKPDQPTSGAVEVQLWLELDPTAGETKSEFEIGGLDVVDAVRQSGWIDIAVSKEASTNLTVTYEAGPDVLEAPVPDGQSRRVDARYEFARSPSSLRMQVATTPRETEISVDPVYILRVASTQVVLDAKLTYRVRGGVPSSVKVDMLGWQVDAASPATMVNDETFDPLHSGQLEIPLRSGAAAEGERFDLEIRATKEIADPNAVVSISLPRPDAKIVMPATVIVQPDNNVELTVQEDDLVGLERESFPPTIDDLADLQQHPLYYRERGDARTNGKPMVFATSLRVRQLAVSVGTVSTLDVDGRSVRVKQELKYQIDHERLDRIPLLVPRAVLAADGLNILCDGKQVEPDEDETSPDAGPARVQVDLDRIGSCSIVVQYEHPVSQLAPDSLNVPLVVPEASDETTVTGSRLEIVPDDVQVEIVEDDWVAVEAGTESIDGEVVLKSADAPSSVTLRIGRSKPQMSTAISRAWLQTWLDSTRRHERAVFRIRTNRNQIEVRLPDRATIQDVVVALDGRRVATSETQSITIKIPGEASPGEHVVELWYHMARKRELVGRIDLDPPVITDAEGSNHWYWQLAMPRDEHLLASPTDMTEEMTWQQRGLFLGRRPRLGQSEIERWIGATVQTPVPETLNHYLFSSFGDVSRRQCAAADRRAILLVVSGFALLTGLALLYVPRLRHPGLLFAGGVALVSVVFLYPSLSVGIAQASCLGLVLIVAAGLLKWFVDLPRTRGVVIEGTPYSSPDSKTVKGPASPIDSHAARPTSTMPAAAPVSAAESST